MGEIGKRLPIDTHSRDILRQGHDLCVEMVNARAERNPLLVDTCTELVDPQAELVNSGSELCTLLVNAATLVNKVRIDRFESLPEIVQTLFHAVEAELNRRELAANPLQLGQDHVLDELGDVLTHGHVPNVGQWSRVSQ